MNCFQYSIPNSPELRLALENLPASLSAPVAGNRIACQPLLTHAARGLVETKRGRSGDAHRLAGVLRAVLEELSHDARVQQSLGEYYGLRLLVTELRDAMENRRAGGDTERFQQIARKLLRELNQPAILAPAPEKAARKALPDAVLAATGVAAFVVVLLALIGGVFVAGMLTAAPL
ncbi:MAG: hypothetical protein H7A53_09835 [Akkermansiaceae bacterium]|nr:hypothetical protein [Akkermansiaceae bacterium]MCP5551176.1 hypothetical protein [Akkermansiaceae bacterium]